MTDIDIPALIEEAAQWRHIIIRKEMAGELPAVGLPAFIEKAAKALSLSVSPLPEEIAELCGRLRHPNYFGQEGMRNEAAAALERMARENWYLKRQTEELDNHRHDAEMLHARISELETERDKLTAASKA